MKPLSHQVLELSSIEAVRAVKTLEMLCRGAVEPWSRGAVETLEPSSCQAVEAIGGQAVEPSSR